MKPKIVRNSVLRWPLAVGLIAAAMVACEKEDEAANTGGESKSAAADITAFGTGSVTWNISGATIAYTYPPETDPLAPLTPTITISKGATITPASGVAQNFFTEAGVTYTVTSEDGTTTKTYVAKATRTPHNGNSITSFIVDDVAWNIDGQLITHTCPPETDTQAPLTPTITISTGATIDPPAGTAQSGFFSATGVQYTVTPEEGAPRVYFAKATRAPYSASSITAFSVNVNGIATAASWTISGTNISYIFPPEAGVTADATFAPNIALSPGATIDPPASEAQNFFPAAGVQYTVTAEDGESTTVYTVKASIQAAGGTTGACSWTLSGYPGTGTYTLTISGTGAMANYGMNGTPWNDYKANINTVVIENGVTAIGNWAFYGCKMTTVEVPESVTAIGERAFQSCPITSIVLHEGLLTIGGMAFMSCTKLAEITIPHSVTTIGTWLFYYNEALTTVTLGNGITETSESTFDGCTKLTSVTFGTGLTTIGKGTFKTCSALTGIQIPQTVTSIGSTAFQYSGLTGIVIPEGVASIGRSAFSQCESLASVTVPASLSTIEEYAFSQCSGLTEFINHRAMPQSINSDVFNEASIGTATLKVPAGAVAAYSSASVWSGFGTKTAIE